MKPVNDKRGYFDYLEKDEVVQPYIPDFLQDSGKVRPLARWAKKKKKTH